MDVTLSKLQERQETTLNYVCSFYGFQTETCNGPFARHQTFSRTGPRRRCIIYFKFMSLVKAFAMGVEVWDIIFMTSSLATIYFNIK